MAQIQHLLSSPIEYLKGVGPQRAELLRKELNISTFDDLLQHFPFRYVDRTQLIKINQINMQLPSVQFIGKLVEKNVWAASQFIAALGDLPANVREPAMERLFARPEIMQQLASNPSLLQRFRYTDPQVSQNVAQMFASNMDKKARENFLQYIAAPQPMFATANFLGNGGIWNAGGASVPQAWRLARAERSLICSIVESPNGALTGRRRDVLGSIIRRCAEI